MLEVVVLVVIPSLDGVLSALEVLVVAAVEVLVILLLRVLIKLHFKERII
jgi:hypothetical protein